MEKVYRLTIRRVDGEEDEFDYDILDWFKGCEYDDTIFIDYEDMSLSLDYLYSWPKEVYPSRWSRNKKTIIRKSELENPYPNK